MIRVLLADDHAIFRQGLANLLQANGAVQLVAEAGNGADAWQLIKRLCPDVAILDIAMPGMSGIDVASRLTRRPDLATRVVLLTSHDDPTLALQAEEAGVVGYVLKENTYEELLEAVTITASGGHFTSPQVAKKIKEIIRAGNRVTLSPREREVLAQIAAGLTDKEIAQALKISPSTVKTHKERLKIKLNLSTKSELAAHAVRVGLST